MKIFITGATGFVGYYIAKQLVANGHEITALVRPGNKNTDILKNLSSKINCVEGTLEAYDLMADTVQDHELIVHAASQVSLNKKDKKSLHQTNVHHTGHLINIALEKNIHKFIYISSIAALGGLPDQKDFDENTEWDLKTYHHAYAVSKHFAEMEVWRGHAEGLQVAILCPSVVLGSWELEHHSMALIKNVLNRNPFYSTGATGWVDVRDVALAVSRVVEKDIWNERIILSAQNESFLNILKMTAQRLHRKAPSIKLPYILALWGTKLLAPVINLINKNYPVTGDVIKSVYGVHRYVNAKSIHLLDIPYRSLEETIDFTCNELYI